VEDVGKPSCHIDVVRQLCFHTRVWEMQDAQWPWLGQRGIWGQGFVVKDESEATLVEFLGVYPIKSVDSIDLVAS